MNLLLVSELIARRLGMPRWMGYRFTWLDGVPEKMLQVEGCVPAGVYSRGPRKGTPRYRHPSTKATRCTVVCTKEGLDREAADWEQETGRCRRCLGTAEVYFRRMEDHEEYRPCPRCGGTGEPRKGKP